MNYHIMPRPDRRQTEQSVLSDWLSSEKEEAVELPWTILLII